MTQPHIQGESRKIALSIRRGFMGKCPNCGQAKLFRKYLKPVDACPNCSEPWTAVRADDGPAWLTIIVVGHLLAPLVIEIVRHPEYPMWLGAIGLPLTAGILSLILLQPIKGLWIGVLWTTRAPTS
ncbi:MAG: DUF983 domain-containing protein [Robiginitomaculum sp.]